ncbi:MAG: hypothetical protein WC675_03030 [Patescibacteria group bacterium]|jgi:hypothetical protein
MFGIRKQKSEKKSKEVANLPPEVNSRLDQQIHVMPQRFYIQPKKKHSGLIIIIIVGILLIGGLIGVAIYLNQNLSQNQAPAPVINTNQPVNTNTNLNQNVNTNTNTNTNVNLNTNVNVNTNTNTNTNVNLNTNVNVNTNLNVNTNTNTNTNASQPLPIAADTDRDNLTLAEESLYGTNPEISDSDSDTYTDGAELLNGYDPTRPAVSLVDSGLFSTYNNSFYSIIYPKNWRVQESNSGKTEVLFVSTTGEFVEVLVLDKDQNLSLADWYREQFSQSSLGQLTAVKINGIAGYRTLDNQSYYLMSAANPSKIFLLHYNVGNYTMTNFILTFQVMVKSFNLVP